MSCRSSGSSISSRRGANEVERAVVERDLREPVIVVVREDEVRRRFADRLLDAGRLAFHHGGDGLDRDRPVLVARQRHLDGVRAQRRVVLGGGLRERERGDPIAVRLPRGGERVERGGLEPQLGPRVQIALVADRARAGLEGVEELRQRRVAEGVALEVGAHAVAEPVEADRGDELLDDGGALAVGDAVEVEERLVGVRDLTRDRVRGDELVLPVRPVLHPGVEGLPGAIEASRAHQREVRHVGGEALVQPQVVPPAHRHEVAEPHVRHLVEDHLAPVEALVVRRRIAEDEHLGEGDRADVLHRPRVELRHEDLVVLAERVRVVEELREEVEPLLCDFEQLRLVHVGDERLAREEAEGDLAVLVTEGVVRPAHEGEQVRREALRRHERVADAAVLQRLARRLGAVRDHLPLGGRGHRQVVARLDVGLIEAGEEAVRAVGLEVGVEVLLAVLRIDELVEAVAGVVVLVLVADPDGVLAGEQVSRQHEPVAVPLRVVHGRAVDLEADDLVAGVVDERAVRGSGGIEGEADRRFASVALGALREVEREVVGDVGDDSGARFGIGLGEDVADGGLRGHLDSSIAHAGGGLTCG